MEKVAYTNGKLANGAVYQFVAHWNVLPGDVISCPEWVTVPCGGFVVVTEVVTNNDEPEQG
jgi:hypothetical protein